MAFSFSSSPFVAAADKDADKGADADTADAGNAMWATGPQTHAQVGGVGPKRGTNSDGTTEADADDEDTEEKAAAAGDEADEASDPAPETEAAAATETAAETEAGS